MLLSGGGWRNKSPQFLLHYLPWLFALLDKDELTPLQHSFLAVVITISKQKILCIKVDISGFLHLKRGSWKTQLSIIIPHSDLFIWFGHNTVLLWTFCKFIVIWPCYLYVNKHSSRPGQLSRQCVLLFIEPLHTCIEENSSPLSENLLKTYILV